MKESLEFYKEHLADIAMSGLSREEYETHAIFNWEDDYATVETTDPAIFRELRKKSVNGDWELIRVDTASGVEDPLTIVAAVFKGPKSLISFRTKKQTLDPERKALSVEALKRARFSQPNG